MTASYDEDHRREGPRRRGTREPVGSVAEEAAKLLSALQGAAATHGFGAGADRRAGSDAGDGSDSADARDPGDGWDPGDEREADGPHECSICPVCRALRLLRQVDPSVYGHLADAAESFAAALRQLVPAPPRRPDRGNGVEHIDIG